MKELFEKVTVIRLHIKKPIKNEIIKVTVMDTTTAMGTDMVMITVMVTSTPTITDTVMVSIENK